MREKKLAFQACIAILCVFSSCKDQGVDLPPPPESPPSISAVVPDSSAVGDTVQIFGSDLGAIQGSSSVTIGGASATTVLSWSSAEIRAEVPLGAVTGSVIVTVEGRSSNPAQFRARQVSYAQSVQTVFNSFCVGCHGGQNNLFVTSYSNLMLGNSNNGPVVQPGNGEGSFLVRMLRGTVSGKDRMPQGGPYLQDARINKISTWITQGAQNN